jgi:DNA polymerase-3 subunit delta'
MHPSAANAVLKILEEPPGKTHFLLVSHHPDRLLATIRSRCFRLAFAAPPPEVARTWLQTRGVSEPDLALALGSFAPLAATGQDPEGEFWSQRKDLLDVLARPGFSALSAAEKAEAIDGPVLARLLAQWAYDLTLLKSGCPARYHLDFRAGLEKVAKSAPVGALTRWYDMVVQYGRVAQHPLNRRLAMESLLAGYPGLK